MDAYVFHISCRYKRVYKGICVGQNACPRHTSLREGTPLSSSHAHLRRNIENLKHTTICQLQFLSKLSSQVEKWHPMANSNINLT